MNMMEKHDKIKQYFRNVFYTLKHWMYYQKVAIRYKVWQPHHLLHDLDKVFLYMFYNKHATSKIHRKNNAHHLTNKKPNYLDAVIDWECARFTKPDKPLNARETLYKFYPEHEKYILPILTKLNL